jgi:predicted nuclease of predicted toxin-antitoxin system
MMIRMYANENFPLETVERLRTFGYNVLTTNDAGRSNLQIPDEDVLDFAIAENRAVLTLNRKDFIRLHRNISKHCGIIVCTKNDDFKQFADAIHKVLSAFEQGISNQLIRVYREG